MRQLPTSIDALRGLRAARWIRESKAGQYDTFGPDAQRRRQDDAIAAFGLIDSGVAWSVAHSGFRKAGRNDVSRLAKSRWWAEMLEAAGRDFDVLLVGYVSRFARDAETLLTTRRLLHNAGAVALFVADRILTSDEDQWEQFAREAVEAEAYSRRMGKRIREGYLERRRRFNDPGGRPPFGFRRNAVDHTVEPDPALAGRVQRIFELAAGRATDREVSLQVGLSIHVIRTTLRSPLYAGRMPDGSPTRFAPPIDPGLWSEVQDVRGRRRTRDGRPARKTPYALSMLRCLACGRRLIGDVGRYRHPELCAAFAAAVHRPKRRVRGQHRETLGASYPVAVYEGAVRAALGRVRLGAGVMAEVLTDPPAAAPDRLASVRISRDRDAALARYRRDRDTTVLEATMARLDADQAALDDAPASPWDPGAARAYLENLEALWDRAPNGRRALAEALFDEVRVLGARRVDLVPSAEAIARGIDEAFRSGSGGYGRGGGSRAFTIRLIPGVDARVRLVLPSRTPRLVEVAS